MNQDILFHVASFSERATLASLCCVSQETRRVAARHLYRTVRARSLHELVAVHGTLERDAWLLLHVVEFFYEHRHDANADSTPAELKMRARVCISDIVHRLTNMETFAFDATLAADSRHLLEEILPMLPRLRSVKLTYLPTVPRASLAPLQHLSLSVARFPGLYQWLSAHAATLLSLRIENYDPFNTPFSPDGTELVFPRLLKLDLSIRLANPGAQCSLKFPAVRWLFLKGPDRALADSWLSLEHLDSVMWDVSRDDRPYSPAVRSLRLRHTASGAREKVRDWASPHVSTLALVLFSDGFAAHVAALDAFSGLRMLDLTLIVNERYDDVGAWLQKAFALRLSHPLLEVLTLRGSAILHEHLANPLDMLRRSVPTLTLLRIVLQEPPQRIAFAPSRPVDWLSACEIVADYLPHWRETRAPWDDIRDI